MGNIFSKFFIAFGINKKDRYLPAPDDGTVNLNTEQTTFSNNAVKTCKTLASFDLHIAEPNYLGAIPDASIKFYPID